MLKTKSVSKSEFVNITKEMATKLFRDYILSDEDKNPMFTGDLKKLAAENEAYIIGFYDTDDGKSYLATYKFPDIKAVMIQFEYSQRYHSIRSSMYKLSKTYKSKTIDKE